MSWVLILNSSTNAKPPAVIGGYPTLEAAEAAADMATACNEGPFTPPPFFTSYVITTTGNEQPSSSIHCYVERNETYDGWVRHKQRFP